MADEDLPGCLLELDGEPGTDLGSAGP